MTLFLAIDGGNSKTDVVIASTSGTLRAYVTGPGSSPHLLGTDGSIALLSTLIARARTAAGLPSSAVLARAEVYLAGADLPIEVETLTKAVNEAGWAESCLVDNDTFALMRAGTDDPNAVAVVCGAGINCVGRRADGKHARFPALGELSGDWGGGEHLARLALWHAVRDEDGRGGPTRLTAAVRDYLGTPSVEEAVIAMHLGDMPLERLFELAPLVFDAAAAGDEVALSLVRRQADEIVTLATVAASRLALDEFTVVLGGGVMRRQDPILHPLIVCGLAARAPGARITVVAERPVLGAALLALDALNATPAAHTALRSSLHVVG